MRSTHEIMKSYLGAKTSELDGLTDKEIYTIEGETI